MMKTVDIPLENVDLRITVFIGRNKAMLVIFLVLNGITCFQSVEHLRPNLVCQLSRYLSFLFLCIIYMICIRDASTCRNLCFFGKVKMAFCPPPPAIPSRFGIFYCGFSRNFMNKISVL